MKTQIKIWVTFCLVILFASYGSAQVKSVEVNSIKEHIRIDGLLNESAWTLSRYAGDFIQYNPFNGAKPSCQSMIKVLYDQTAIYVGAMMYDPFPDSIYRELGLRDSEHLNADFFSVDISPYDDGLNAFSFNVTASGVQIDSKISSSDEDDVTWDAVWESAVRIVDSGWIAELRIPYSAIRFSETSGQTWGVNFFRNIQRYREVSAWNFVDVTKSGVLSQMGKLTGLVDIKPPLRLSLMPYISEYLNKEASETSWNSNFNFGMDLKLGLNESFTLDMTLIPDFGQVPSDDQIYNLTPYEVFYDEKRPFFTEGTELFEKGNVFYSRRIGDMPEGYNQVYDDLKDGEIVTDNPDKSNLINATKLSGRTKAGLGIGLFNAMTSTTYATIYDTISKSERKIETQPFTNYNMIVFDQNLKNNSYLSLYNTNVYSGADETTANVSGTEFTLKNKENTYAVSGRVNVSQKYNHAFSPDIGHLYDVGVAKISGNFRANFQQSNISDRYDPNDMGFLQRNNLFSNNLTLQYNIYQPFGKFLYWYNSLSFKHNMLYAPRTFTDFSANFSSRFNTVKHLTVGVNGGFFPYDNYDYFEPRVPGWYYIRPPSWNLYGFISPDYRKNFVVDLTAGYYDLPEYNQYSIWFRVNPRIRFSQRLLVLPGFSYTSDINSIGYVNDSLDVDGNQVIIMGRRDLNTMIATIEANLILTLKQAVSFRLRHYWLTADYDQFYNLLPNGRIAEIDYTENHDFSYNIFNIDLSYSWEFAPGSHFSVVWKNDINTYQPAPVNNYYDNIKYTFEAPSGNSFSVKVLYYLDYQYLKKKS